MARWKCQKCGNIQSKNKRACRVCGHTVFSKLNGGRPRIRGGIDATSRGFNSMVFLTKDVLSGKTTVRDTSRSVNARILLALYYPIAVIGAIIQPVVWLSLVTIFSPSAILTPYIVKFVELMFVAIIIIYFIPTGIIIELAPFLVDVQLTLRGIINRILIAVDFELLQ